ncbi:MAG TPA: VWA domain-containing protein [Thermoanaerobaculia bacterium]|nr:VWA domain-containing protein [Thermoanaerobaculia bacterium]
MNLFCRPQRLALAAVAAALLFLSSASAPAAPPAADSGFGEAVDVRVVNVEAVVTDRAGERVRGLTPADFRLLVDGAPVAIDYFTEVVEGESAAPPAVAAAPVPSSDGRIGRSILVFVDESFAVASQRNQVLDELGRELSRLAPADRMAIVAFDGRRLALLAGWTGDARRLQAALETARRRPARGIEVIATRRSLRREAALISMPSLERSRGRLDLDRSQPGLREGVTAREAARIGERWPDLAGRARGAVSAAAAALRGVPPAEGRKIMLLLAGAWPYSANDDVLAREPARASILAPHLTRGVDLYRPLSDTANLLGYTIYAVDVQGRDILSVIADAEDSLPGLGAMTSEWEHETHDALRFLAAETGGAPLLDNARLAALERVAEDTRAYYWLGFTPTWQANDVRHDVQVQVLRPGLRVRTRSGFTDLSRASETARRTESVLLFGGVAGDRQLRVEVGKATRAGPRMARLPVTIAVPTEALSVYPSAEGFRAEVTLSLAALDRWGGRSPMPQLPLRMVLAEAPLPGSAVRFQVNLRLRRIDQRVVFGVHDALSGAMLWNELDLDL